MDPITYLQLQFANRQVARERYNVCVINSWCKRDRGHEGDCAPERHQSPAGERTVDSDSKPARRLTSHVAPAGTPRTIDSV